MMLTQAKKIPNPEVVAPTPRKRHTPAFKRRVLTAIEQLPFGERGAFLRSQGLYSGTVSRWRRELEAATLVALTPKKTGPKAKRNPAEDEVDSLRRQVSKLEHKLSVAQDIIAAQKKISTLLEGALATPTDGESSERS